MLDTKSPKYLEMAHGHISLSLPLDHMLLLDEPVHRLELGDAPLLRKKVDLAHFVTVHQNRINGKEF